LQKIDEKSDSSEERLSQSNERDLNSLDMKDNDSDDRNKKRFRRTANEIERRFVCWCGKAYGSEGSLNQHKKIKKHFGEVPPEGYQM
jgi:hypothetical protein